MKLNEYQAILTSKVLLVPYSPHHVPTYHEWMKDEELQQATASEPLSLEQEYAMQKSWREDADKLTFIACTATSLEGELEVVEAGKHETPDSMIGDVNLFLYEDEDADEGDDASRHLFGEVEIMIAKKSLQGQGYGRAVLLAFLWYIRESVAGIVEEYNAKHGVGKSLSSLTCLKVKIGAENTRSINLFESVGFIKAHEKPNYFGELELRLPITAETTTSLNAAGDNEPLIIDYKMSR